VKSLAFKHIRHGGLRTDLNQEVELGVVLGAGVEAGALDVLSLDVDGAFDSAGGDGLAESETASDADSAAETELLEA
jgi:hypothetical protein